MLPSGIVKPWKLFKPNKRKGLLSFCEVKFFWVLYSYWSYQNALQDQLITWTWLSIAHKIHNLDECIARELIELLLYWRSCSFGFQTHLV